jgi:hypothetical protein
MPAATPEQIHRLFEDLFNAGDLDGLMELYESDAALIAQPGSVAHGSEQVRAALQGFLALKGRITLDTQLVITVDDLPICPTPGRSAAPGPMASRLLWAPRRPRWRGARPTAPGACDGQRLGRSGGLRLATDRQLTDRVDPVVGARSQGGQSAGI